MSRMGDFITVLLTEFSLQLAWTSIVILRGVRRFIFFRV